jgi:predicted AlkP superfamily phosphohydrolase/phosphomutase
MSSSKPKFLLIGVDQSIPYLLNKFIDDDILPNIESLIENGVYTEAYSCPPCDTPTNWTTIATGATTATHGVTSFYLHLSGEPFEHGLEKRSRTQLSKYCKAEYLWNVADNNGLTPFVVNYPSGWPSKFKHGAMAVLIWQVPETLPRVLSPPKSYSFSTNSDENSNPITKAKIDEEFFQDKLEPLIINIELTPVNAIKKTFFRGYISNIKSKDYDSLSFFDEEEKKWKSIPKNVWSDWISVNIATSYENLPCLMKIKIEELSKTAESIIIKTSTIYNTKGWTAPEKLGVDLIKNVISHDLTPKMEDIEYKIEGDVESYLKYAQNEVLTIGQAVKYAKKSLDWNVCFFHVHLLDSVNHKELAYLHESSPIFSEENTEKAENNVKTAYMMIDGLVGDLLNSCVDDNTIVTFVSDHGAMPAWKIVNIPLVLMKSGLLSYKWKAGSKSYEVDWKNTYAFPYIEPPFVWVNLKGRDPNGIVNPADFDSIRDQIIDIFYELKDPDTGKRCIKLALKREEAAFLGLNGERIGDIIYFLNPPYQIYDEVLEQLNPSQISTKYMSKPEVYNAKRCFGAHVYYLPTEKLGNYSNSVPLIMSGPGIKKGIKLKKPVNLIDLAPTYANLLSIPRPATSEGRVIFEIFD